MKLIELNQIKGLSGLLYKALLTVKIALHRTALHIAIKPRFSRFLLLYNCDDQPKAATRHQGSNLYRLGGAPVLFQSLHPPTVHCVNAAWRRL